MQEVAENVRHGRPALQSNKSNSKGKYQKQRKNVSCERHRKQVTCKSTTELPRAWTPPRSAQDAKHASANSALARHLSCPRASRAAAEALSTHTAIACHDYVKLIIRNHVGGNSSAVLDALTSASLCSAARSAATADVCGPACLVSESYSTHPRSMSRMHIGSGNGCAKHKRNHTESGASMAESEAQ